MKAFYTFSSYFQRWDPRKTPPKHDFDRKVAEADAYLQLLIDQIKQVDQKQNLLKEEDEEKRQRYDEILSQANLMLNAVKHAIVQLQIAKACVQPSENKTLIFHRVNPHPFFLPFFLLRFYSILFSLVLMNHD